MNFYQAFIPSLKLKQKLKRFYIKDEDDFEHKLSIKKAPEPSDIIWTGLASTSNKMYPYINIIINKDIYYYYISSPLRIKSNLLVLLSLLIGLSILVFVKKIVREE